MARPCLRVPPARFWAWLFFVVVGSLRLLASPHPQGARHWSDPPPVPGPCTIVEVVRADLLVVAQPHLPDGVPLALFGAQAPPAPAESLKWQQASTEFARRFLAAGDASLELGRIRLDARGRYLADVRAGEESLAAALLEAGLARHVSYPGNLSLAERRLRAAEASARGDRRGLWGDSPPATR